MAITIYENRYSNIKIMAEEKYGITIKSDYNSTFAEIINEIDYLTNIIDKSNIYMDSDDIESIVGFYEQFFLENASFIPGTPSDEYCSYVIRNYIEVYEESMLPGIPSGEDFFNSLLDVNSQLARACAELKFKAYYILFCATCDSHENILKALNSELHIHCNDKKLDFNILLDDYLSDVENSTSQNNSDFFNPAETYFEISNQLGELELQSVDLDYNFALKVGNGSAELVSNAVKKEEDIHMIKDKESSFRCYVNNSQGLVNPKLLTNGCSCVSNKFHHSIYIYINNIEDTEQKLLEGN